MNEKINYVEYLENVLVSWSEFCNQHNKFEKALKEVLEENKRLKAQMQTCKKYESFYEYFSALYGTGLEVANWHLNGDMESFDSFFNAASESCITPKDKQPAMCEDLKMSFPNKVACKYPCRSCVYFEVCGDNMRTMPCDGRQTKSQKKRSEE